ncbi:MAG: family 16 glycoside hydrolase, partial [Gemmataceae bacterium]
MVRRISLTGGEKSIEILVKALVGKSDPHAQLQILQSIDSGLKGQRRVPSPQSWVRVGNAMMAHSDQQVKETAIALAIRFGDPRAIQAMKGLLVDNKASFDSRQRALFSLVEAREPSAVELIQSIAERKDELQLEAIRSLASFDHVKTPGILLKAYPLLDPAGKRSALNTLTSRVSYGKALMTAVSGKKIPASDLSADLIRQLRKLEDGSLERQINDVWGQVRTTPLEGKALISKYLTILRNPKSAPDLSHGRAVFNKVCSQCHTLFGEGGKVGPDITGANRASLDYLLENILDPSGVIPKEYAMSVLLLVNGRVISGIVREENDQTITVVTQNETLTILKKDLEKRELSSQSMMPDDIFKNLADKDIFSLVAYLQTPFQVPVLANSENVKEFFNGKDLRGWVGDGKYWRVENGEIVGSSPGLKHNEFLKSKMTANDFELRFKVKLSPNHENSGVQFRSEELPKGEMKGPQADIGQGWWGKLYEENGRGLLWGKSGDVHVKKDDWNDYVIEAKRANIRTWINGKLCVDLQDPKISQTGIFALQL